MPPELHPNAIRETYARLPGEIRLPSMLRVLKTAMIWTGYANITIYYSKSA
ncbi:hypothetical protein MASR1M36_11240 [Candidatus Cloacimonadaceae bacterium]